MIRTSDRVTPAAKWLSLLFLLALVAILLQGCATAGRTEDDESELPWNTPQPWEAAPTIPGLEGQ